LLYNIGNFSLTQWSQHPQLIEARLFAIGNLFFEKGKAMHNGSVRTRVKLIALLGNVLILIMNPPLAAAKVGTLTMPQDYADYCLHPQSGDLAAVSTEQGEVHLYRQADLAAENLVPYAKVRVGTTPSAICFKRFGELELFAVVGTEEAKLSLINAKNGTLYRQVPLAGTGFSQVFASLNPDDPFVYYCFDQKTDCKLGVVNLRSLKSYDMRYNAMDGGISSTGRILYLRDAYSPSGLNSYRLGNEFTDEQPEFTRVVSEHREGGPYLPDPFEQYTASGQELFIKTLERRVADLRMLPLGFSRTKPLIFGIENDDTQRGRILLRAASYNTFGKKGKPIPLSLGFTVFGNRLEFNREDEGELPRGSNDYRADYKRVRKKPRLLADDLRDRVLFAYRTEIQVVPLAEFELQPEPLLLAKLSQPPVAALGQEWHAELELFDPLVEVEFTELPAGMQAQGQTLRWRPSEDQVGQHKIAAKLKYRSLERVMNFDISASFPATTLPYAPYQFLLNIDGTKALLATGPQARQDLLRRLLEFDGGRLTWVEIATGKVLLERKLTEQLELAAMTPEHVILLRANEKGCEILKQKTLEREKILLTKHPIKSIRVMGSLLVLQTDHGGEVYDLGTFQKRKTFEATPDPRGERSPLAFLNDSLVVGGVIYDQVLHPQLVYSVQGMPVLPGAKHDWVPRDIYLPYLNDDDDRFSRPQAEGEFRLARSTPQGTIVEAIMRDIILQGKQNFEISVQIQNTPESQRLYRGPLQLPLVLAYFNPLLRVTEQTAVVVQGRNMYCWTIPAKVPTPVDAAERPVQFELRQSALALSGTGTTRLEHKAHGGKPPLKYAVLTPYEGIKIDESTGTVTIEEQPLLDEASQAIEKYIVEQYPFGADPGERLRKNLPALQAEAKNLFGQQPKGAPVAIPLSLEVTDAEGEVSQLQYFVLADVPSTSIEQRLKQHPGQSQEALRQTPEKQTAQQKIDELENQVESQKTLLYVVIALAACLVAGISWRGFNRR